MGGNRQMGGKPVTDTDRLQIEAGGITTVLAEAVTPSNTAYTAGDDLGGLITLTGAVRIPGGTGVLQSLTIDDANNIKPAMELVIWDRNPAAATITDNAAFAASTTAANILGHFTISAADWVTIGSSHAYATYTNLGLAVQANGSANLYVALIMTGTPTFASPAAITLHFGFLQD